MDPHDQQMVDADLLPAENLAEARQTAKGYVVSLPDILFDLNQASLKREAERPLAKLAGILVESRGLDPAKPH